MNSIQLHAKAYELFLTLGEDELPSQEMQDHIIDLVIQCYRAAISEKNQTLQSEAQVILTNLLLHGIKQFKKNPEKFAEILGEERQFYKLPTTLLEINNFFSQHHPTEVQTDTDIPSMLFPVKKRIRIIIDNGPNYGNQAANVNVVNRLRQMGMHGIIELIYPKEAAAKIAQLLNLQINLLNQSNQHFDAKLNIQFIEINEFYSRLAAGKVEKLIFGMTGGIDKFIPEWYLSDVHSPIELTDTLQKINFANFLNVETFAWLSPYYLYDREWSDTRIYLQNVALPILQENSRNKMLVTPISTLSQAKKYLLNDPDGIIFLEKNPAINTLIHATDNQKINLFPIYGRSVKDNPKNLFTLMLGARYAQLNNSNNKKPLIIATFFEINADTAVTLNLDSKIAAYKLQLLDSLKKVSISDPSAAEIISTLKENDILLLQMGKLPKLLFDALYTQSGPNIWPQVREGASSLTSLLTTTGRPHIHCGSEFSTWNLDFSLTTSTVQSKLEQLNSAVCPASDTTWKSTEQAKIIGEFILDAQNPGSEISDFFHQLKQQALEPDNDRILIALKIAAELIRLPKYELQSVLERNNYTAKFHNSKKFLEKKIISTPTNEDDKLSKSDTFKINSLLKQSSGKQHNLSLVTSQSIDIMQSSLSTAFNAIGCHNNPTILDVQLAHSKQENNTNSREHYRSVAADSVSFLSMMQYLLHFSPFTLRRNRIIPLTKNDKILLAQHTETLKQLEQTLNLIKTKKRAYRYGINIDKHDDVAMLLKNTMLAIQEMLKKSNKTSAQFSYVENNIGRIQGMIPQLTNKKIEKSLRHADIQQDRLQRRARR